VTCYTQPCKPCKVKYVLDYIPQGDESSPRGRWGICAPSLPDVLTEAQENNSVQYTADIIVEIKNRDGTVVPMRALLHTGTTATIILREFVGKGRARTNTNKKNKVENTWRNIHNKLLITFGFQISRDKY
jgi:hypothetical protein